ncbi:MULTISPECIES: class II aldolase/adducin family protein [Actinospica]|uniref:Class II aldolase/adducin family protein n=1 Tax=Actinospica durhamensis TaxID=1508375 RepID=A0A941IS96_9ACTN|nr:MULTISPECIES: class II aldolase/adducin family protein [Actinospica]MBR7836142.1 class II aldolase/adducin family protein [Actinospica durhamensis]
MPSADPAAGDTRRPTAEPLAPSGLQPIPEADLIFPRPPAHQDPAVERRHRKERLAAALRLFGRFGFEEGVAGHITARDPEYPDHFWINPLGVSFKQIKVRDLLLVSHAGEVVQGRHRVNRAAFAIHAAIHRTRPDVVAAAHSHSVYGKALSATGQLLEPLTQDACAFYQDHALFDDYTGLVNDLAEGGRIADALGDRKAAILRNHGLLTVGSTVDSAAWWFITMERSAQAQLAAKAAGPTVRITDEDAKLTYGQIGGEFVGWFQFQPLFAQISGTDPDLFG